MDSLTDIVQYGLTIQATKFSQLAYYFLPSMWDLLKDVPSRSGMVFTFETLHGLKCFAENRGVLKPEDIPTVAICPFTTLLELEKQMINSSGVISRVKENPDLCWVLFGAGTRTHMLSFYCFCCDKKQDMTRWQKYCFYGHVFDGDMKQCSQCKKARYCSRKCQQEHWQIHKHTCVGA
jgi:hypothetical protein